MRCCFVPCATVSALRGCARRRPGAPRSVRTPSNSFRSWACRCARCTARPNCSAPTRCIDLARSTPTPQAWRSPTISRSASTIRISMASAKSWCATPTCSWATTRALKPPPPTKDGWMRSGDAGYFNDGRQLVVIDRIKDLAETARGERFSPQYIENKLKFSPYIAETVVLGAGRDALAAMICIRFSIISKWAEKSRISFTTYTDLASRPEVYALLRKEVEAVNVTLPPAQRMSRFLLLYKELDADDGELTRTRKVRRSVVNEKYADIIDAIYRGESNIPVDTVIRFQDGTTQRIRTTLAVVDLGRDTATAQAAE